MRHISSSGKTIWKGSKKFGNSNWRTGVKVEDVEGYLLANWDEVQKMLEESPPAKVPSAIGN
tara:strand:- start:191 stop:376 length:186 start_codon:yes stop_codon:yes gene_type:complete